MSDFIRQGMESYMALSAEMQILIAKAMRLMVRSPEFIDECKALMPPGEECPRIPDIQALVDRWSKREVAGS